MNACCLLKSRNSEATSCQPKPHQKASYTKEFISCRGRPTAGSFFVWWMIAAHTVLPSPCMDGGCVASCMDRALSPCPYLVLCAWGLLAARAVLPSLQCPDCLGQPLPWVSSRGAEGGQQRGWARAMLHDVVVFVVCQRFRANFQDDRLILPVMGIEHLTS